MPMNGADTGSNVLVPLVSTTTSSSRNFEFFRQGRDTMIIALCIELQCLDHCVAKESNARAVCLRHEGRKSRRWHISRPRQPRIHRTRARAPTKSLLSLARTDQAVHKRCRTRANLWSGCLFYIMTRVSLRAFERALGTQKRSTTAGGTHVSVRSTRPLEARDGPRCQ